MFNTTVGMKSSLSCTWSARTILYLRGIEVDEEELGHLLLALVEAATVRCPPFIGPAVVAASGFGVVEKETEALAHHASQHAQIAATAGSQQDVQALVRPMQHACRELDMWCLGYKLIKDKQP